MHFPYEPETMWVWGWEHWFRPLHTSDPSIQRSPQQEAWHTRNAGMFPSPHIPPSVFSHRLHTSILLLLLLFVSYPIHPCSSSSSLSLLLQWPMSIWRTMGFLGFLLLLLGPLRLSIITWWPATAAPIVNYSYRGLEPLQGPTCLSISPPLMVSNREQTGSKWESWMFSQLLLTFCFNAFRWINRL